MLDHPRGGVRLHRDELRPVPWTRSQPDAVMTKTNEEYYVTALLYSTRRRCMNPRAVPLSGVHGLLCTQSLTILLSPWWKRSGGSCLCARQLLRQRRRQRLGLPRCYGTL